MVFDRVEQEPCLHPVIVLDDLFLLAFRRIARMDRHWADAAVLRQMLHHDGAGAPGFLPLAPTGKRACREPEPGRDLLRLLEIAERRLGEGDAAQGDNALITLHALALIDSHGEMAFAEKGLRRGLLELRHHCGIEAGIASDAAG